MSIGNRSISGFTAITLTLTLVVGCATGYTDSSGGLGFGYKTEKVKDNIYYIEFIGNGFSHRKTIVEYWHRRAAEVCGGKDKYEIYTKMTVPGYHDSITELDPNTEADVEELVLDASPGSEKQRESTKRPDLEYDYANSVRGYAKCK